MYKQTILASAVALAASGSLQANTFDGKAMGMSDAGVATADYMSSMTLNPAALADYDERRGLNLHMNIGTLVSDEDSMVDGADELSETLDSFDNQVIDQAMADELTGQLEAINGDQAWLEGGGGLYLSIPAGSFSVGLYGQTRLGVNVTTSISEDDMATISDLAEITEIANNFDSTSSITQDDIDTINDLTGLNVSYPPSQADIDAVEDFANNNNFDTDDLDSEIIARGASVTEGGLKIAKQFGNASFGITPKYQRVDSIEYISSADNFDEDDFDADQYTTDDANYNLDLGYQQTFGNWRVGASATNLIEQEYHTVNGKTIKIEPKLTLGGGYRSGWLTAAVDIDANATENLGTGQSSQFARFGLELDAFNWAQLRLGFKSDLESTLDDTISAGIGLSPFGIINLDISAIYGENDTYGAVMQFGLTF